LRFLLSADPVAAEMRRTAIFKIFPLCDPDGVARGGVRFNANGFDLNRNWDAPNLDMDETKMPEIAAQRKAILDWVDAGQRVDFFSNAAQHRDFGIPGWAAGCRGALPFADGAVFQAALRKQNLRAQQTTAIC
jgi:hypothetical protein